jgi:asparagine synthase (glutamine-hydrolysing)
MSGIFGILSRNGAPIAPSALQGMMRSLSHWQGHTFRLLPGETVAFGTASLWAAPQQEYETLPRRDQASGISFAAYGRLDNRADLVRTLDRSQSELAQLSDNELMVQAYLQWGVSCSQHLLGDWAFAAWAPSTNTLFLARDHFGITSLFYYAGKDIFVFAPTRQALLDMNLFPAELDELYLAQVLVDWHAYEGERTIHRSVQRLSPGHCLSVTPVKIEVNEYWKIQDVEEVRWPRREDYAEAFTSIFDRAVAARVQTPGKNSAVATMLSGGLDSTSVTTTAAAILREQNLRLGAFTSVPLSDPIQYAGDRLGDEYPFAAATAQFAGNVDLHAVMAENVSPISGIRRQLEILGEPNHDAGNAYWILEIERMAQAQGFQILLTGQQGHAGMSWAGDPRSQPLSVQLRQMQLGEWSGSQWTALKAQFSHGSVFRDMKARREERSQWHRRSAIRLDFAQRLNLLEQRLSDPYEMRASSPREQRYQILKPGRSTIGAVYAELGAAYGLEFRDPTADVRVIEFALSVPDEIFIDPHSGINRWLIREAMKGRMPDEVRLNRRRGRQAADLLPRLRSSGAEVEQTLAELEGGAVAAYLDIPYMREVWEMVKTQDTPEALGKARTVLTRGIGAGLFVNHFSSRPALRKRAAAAYSANQIEVVQ